MLVDVLSAYPWVAVAVAVFLVLLVLSAIIVTWLNLSKRKIAYKYRAWDNRDTDAYPHFHTISGQTFYHSHVRGAVEHSHKTVSIPIDTYVELMKKASSHKLD